MKRMLGLALLLAAAPMMLAPVNAAEVPPEGTEHEPIASPPGADGWAQATSTEGGYSIAFPGSFTDTSYDGIRSPPGQPLHVNDIHKLQGLTSDETRLTAMCIATKVGHPNPSKDVLNTSIAGCRAHGIDETTHLRKGETPGLVRGINYDQGSCLLFIEFPNAQAAVNLPTVKAHFFGSFTPPPTWKCENPG